MATPPIPLLIDTDPGVDDALALFLALASPELELRAVTTVAGNGPLPLVTANAGKLLAAAGRADIPLHPGCPRPLLRPLETAEGVHGDDALGNLSGPEALPAASFRPRDEHAVAALIRLLGAAAGQGAPLTLVTLGPLTNLALALIAAPQIAGGIARVVAMLGATKGGNSTPVAEFNALVDPHAARIVIEAGLDLTLVPLDVTHQALVTAERLERFAALTGRVGRAVAAMLRAYVRFDKARYGWAGGPIHDPCCIAFLLAPHLFAGRRVCVQMATDDPLTAGQTVVDWWNKTGRPANALVLERIDADGFFDLLLERFARLP